MCVRVSVRVCVRACPFEYKFVWVRMCRMCVFAFGNSRHSVFYMYHTRDDDKVCKNPDLCEFPSSSIRRISALTFAIVCFSLIPPISPVLFFLSPQYTETFNYLIANSRHVARRRCCG